MRKKIEQYIKHHKRGLGIAASSIVVVATGTFLWLYLIEGAAPVVPPEFTDAIQRMDKLAPQLLTEANRTSQGTAEIEKLLQNNDKGTILGRIAEEKKAVANIRNSVGEMPRDIEVMINTLPGIKPRAARQVATEAVANLTKFAQSLVKFSDLMNQTLSVLEKGVGGEDISSELSALASQVNNEVTDTNDFSGKYGTLMAEFRKITHEDAPAPQG